MSDLREKLATQLLMALVEGRTQVERPDTDPDNVGGTAINVIEAWNYVADECIRQMEWARLQGGLAADGQLPDAEALTPAPEDWTPEKVGPKKLDLEETDRDPRVPANAIEASRAKEPQ